MIQSLKPIERAAIKTPVDERALWVVLQVVRPELSAESRSLLMAQWALETGRGKSCICYNIGNFKALPQRDWCYFSTIERLPELVARKYIDETTDMAPAEFVKKLETGAILVRFKPRHHAAKFAAYASLEDGVADYARVLQNRFKQAWKGVEDGDVHEFINGLLQGRYFTGSPLVYYDSVHKLHREYLNKFSG